MSSYHAGTRRLGEHSPARPRRPDMPDLPHGAGAPADLCPGTRETQSHHTRHAARDRRRSSSPGRWCRLVGDHRTPRKNRRLTGRSAPAEVKGSLDLLRVAKRPVHPLGLVDRDRETVWVLGDRPRAAAAAEIGRHGARESPAHAVDVEPGYGSSARRDYDPHAPLAACVRSLVGRTGHVICVCRPREGACCCEQDREEHPETPSLHACFAHEYRKEFHTAIGFSNRPSRGQVPRKASSPTVSPGGRPESRSNASRTPGT